MEATTNKGQIYIIVCTIAILALVCVVNYCYLANSGKDVPRGLDLLTGSLVGALTGMLVKTSPTQTVSTNHAPVPSEVTVVNKPNDPVPTEETKI